MSKYITLESRLPRDTDARCKTCGNDLSPDVSGGNMITFLFEPDRYDIDRHSGKDHTYSSLTRYCSLECTPNEDPPPEPQPQPAGNSDDSPTYDGGGTTANPMPFCEMCQVHHLMSYSRPHPVLADKFLCLSCYVCLSCYDRPLT